MNYGAMSVSFQDANRGTPEEHPIFREPDPGVVVRTRTARDVTVILFDLEVVREQKLPPLDQHPHRLFLCSVNTFCAGMGFIGDVRGKILEVR